jgi:cytochrome P450
VLLLNIGVANRCNDHIANPEQLNIKRKNNLVFGYGLHECLGQSLAHLVGEVAISTLLEQTGSLRLVSPEKLEWVQQMETPDGQPNLPNGLRGLKALPVEILPEAGGPANDSDVYQVAS